MPNDELKPQREIAVRKTTLENKEIKKFRENLTEQARLHNISNEYYNDYNNINNQNIAKLENRVEQLETYIRNSLGDIFMQVGIFMGNTSNSINGAELISALSNLGLKIKMDSTSKLGYRRYAEHKIAEAQTKGIQPIVEL